MRTTPLIAATVILACAVQPLVPKPGLVAEAWAKDGGKGKGGGRGGEAAGESSTAPAGSAGRAGDMSFAEFLDRMQRDGRQAIGTLFGPRRDAAAKR